MAADPATVAERGLTDGEAAARFGELQKKLVPLWKSIERLNDDEQTIVVVPSNQPEPGQTGAEMQAFEERFLFLLFLLRQPRAELVYVTSRPIHAGVVEYYLNLLPGVIASHARRRLHLVATHDGSPRPLTEKLLERPRLVERIRERIRDKDRAHLVPYGTSVRERDLALALGIPMYGADPRYFPLGTKSGCRRIFAEEGVPHPLGVGDVATEEDLMRALSVLRARRPGIAAAIVKHNDGASGRGNAVVDLAGLAPPGTEAEYAALPGRIGAMRLDARGTTRAAYLERLAAEGGIVEERIAGPDLRSPSVQLRVTPLGEVEVLSTHDQLLGGPGGQTFMGCRFPASPEYAPLITREALKVGRRLAREGVLGRFAIDFVVVRAPGGGFAAHAIELNLRKGGTTHPFLTLQFLTDGRYDPETAVFTAPSGRRKFFVSSDHLQSPLYRALTPDDVLDLVVRRRLHFDGTRQTGVVFHMMCALSECGRIGLTAVGDSPEAAEGLYRETTAALDEEARAALAPRPLPPVA